MHPIINSEKRIVQITLSTIPVTTVANTPIVIAEQDPTASAPTNVAAGTVVKAVYVEMWYLGTGQQPPTMTVILHKLSSGGGNPDSTEMGNLNAWENKKNILETHQGFIGDANTNPVPMFRQWIKIPKGKQRFGLGDSLVLSAKSISDEVQFCGVFIFKAYN